MLFFGMSRSSEDCHEPIIHSGSVAVSSRAPKSDRQACWRIMLSPHVANSVSSGRLYKIADESDFDDVTEDRGDNEGGEDGDREIIGQQIRVRVRSPSAT